MLASVMLKCAVLLVPGMSALQLQNLATIAAAAAAAQNTNPSSANPMSSSTNGGTLGSLASQGAEIFSFHCALVCILHVAQG